MFFVIVFIAQLIVTAKIISVLTQASAAVCNINNQVTELRPVVVSGLSSASGGVKSAAKGVGFVTKFLEKRKRAVLVSVIKCILGITIFMLIKKFPHKRYLSFIDVIFNFENLLV